MNELEATQTLTNDKEQLDDALFALVQDFEKRTGLCVQQIDLVHVDDWSAEPAGQCCCIAKALVRFR